MSPHVCYLEQVNKLEESFDVINSGTKPLAAYVFTNNKKLKEHFVRTVSAGGVVVNDTTIHVIYYLLSLLIHHCIACQFLNNLKCNNVFSILFLASVP